MKYGLCVLAVLVGVILFGCGGGGGGGTSTTSTTSATSTSSTGSDVFVIQIVAVTTTGAQVDPTNLQVGDSVTFKLAKIDKTASTITYITTGGFTTTDTANAAGKLNGATGVYVAETATNGKTYTVSTGTYTALYAVTPVQARVTGSVIDSNGIALEFPQLDFFNSSGTQVGSVTSTVTGTFNASVPTTATSFNLVSSSISTSSYFENFVYGNGTYSPLISTCTAPLPALTSGVTTPLPNTPVVTAVSGAGGVQNSPPAPPTCSQ